MNRLCVTPLRTAQWVVAHALRRLCLLGLALFLLMPGLLSAATGSGLSGILSDTQGKLVPDATVTLLRRADSSRRETRTNQSGEFSFSGLDAGEYRVIAESKGFAVLERTVVIGQNEAKVADLQFSDIAPENQSVTVTASVSDTGVFVPDPAQRVMIRDETLDANPGRPGMPISIPGMPIESRPGE